MHRRPFRHQPSRPFACLCPYGLRVVEVLIVVGTPFTLIEVSVIDKSPSPLKRPGDLASTTVPATPAPAGITTTPLTAIAWASVPVNESPGFAVLVLMVLPMRMTTPVPAGITNGGGGGGGGVGAGAGAGAGAWSGAFWPFAAAAAAPSAAAVAAPQQAAEPDSCCPRVDHSAPTRYRWSSLPAADFDFVPSCCRP